MALLHRTGVAACAVVALAAALTLANPSPPEAKANIACDIGVAPAAPITGAIGIGNPVGDACNAVTDPVLGAIPDPLGPIKDAAESIGSGIFEQITTWAAEGATWLMGRVAALTVKTTSPNLLSKGFLRQYRQMAQVAAVLAVLMLIFACLEGLGRGDGSMLWRVFLVNVPVAALATSAAYVVVQLLIATTDGFSEVVARSTASDSRDFFKSAIESLAIAGAGAGTAAGGPGAGTAGATAVPLFVGFIAAIVAAFAAFLVWIELLMRDAAIYAVALFMPLAIAASIWPRWTSALRRTGELVIVVVFSKFVIVAIIALAASLLVNTGGKVEHVLAAGALMLLACFAPFVLFRLVPFAEGAVSSAFNRQSAGGASVRTVASSVQMMRRAALANWAVNSTKAKDGSGVGDSGSLGGGGSPKRTPRGGGGGGAAGGGSQVAGASGGATGAVALPAAGVSATKESQAAAGKLASSGTSQASSAAGSSGASGGSGAEAAGGGREAAPRPRTQEGGQRSDAAARAGDGGFASGGGAPSSSKTSSAPEPREASGGEAASSGTKPPRPGGDVGAARMGGANAGKGKA